MALRSLHFVPADRPRFLERAPELPADLLIADVEDGVAPSEREEALLNLAAWLPSLPEELAVMVRVNGPDSPWYAGERELLAAHPRSGVVLPKVESREQARAALEAYQVAGERRAILLVESFAAIAELPRLGMPGVMGIGLGVHDLVTSLPFALGELDDLLRRVRTDLALACHRHGVVAIDGPSLDTSGGEGVDRECRRARSAGMMAKFTIHPSQIEAVNRTFAPSPEVLREARELLAAVGDTPDVGYARIDGRIVSPPKLEKARTVVAWAERS
jgi:citrate lyase subunit beta/citryl-CoA lyase